LNHWFIGNTQSHAHPRMHAHCSHPPIHPIYILSTVPNLYKKFHIKETMCMTEVHVYVRFVVIFWFCNIKFDEGETPGSQPILLGTDVIWLRFSKHPPFIYSMFLKTIPILMFPLKILTQLCVSKQYCDMFIYMYTCSFCLCKYWNSAHCCCNITLKPPHTWAKINSSKDFEQLWKWS
jgi:hypothetical protein